MGWNGSGGFDRLEDFTDDLAAGPPDNIVSASKVDNEFDNFKAGLQNCLTRDGQNTPSTNLSFGNYKITSLGTPTASTDAATKAYVDGVSYLGSGLAALSTDTPSTLDLIGFADVSSSNAGKKATVLAIVEAALGKTVTALNALIAEAAPAGITVPFSGSSAPTGWLLCHGQAVSRTTYAALFTAISTTYGTGDGSTTFNLPDLRGRSVFGKDDMGGSAANRVTAAGSGITGATLGATGGAQTHTLTTGQLPNFSLDYNYPTGVLNGGGGIWQGGNDDVSITTGTTSSIGSGQAHNNMPPAMMLNWIIKT